MNPGNPVRKSRAATKFKKTKAENKKNPIQFDPQELVVFDPSLLCSPILFPIFVHVASSDTP